MGIDRLRNCFLRLLTDEIYCKMSCGIRHRDTFKRLLSGLYGSCIYLGCRDDCGVGGQIRVFRPKHRATQPTQNMIFLGKEAK